MAKKSPAKPPAKRKPRPKKPAVDLAKEVAEFNRTSADLGRLIRKRIEPVSGKVVVYEIEPPPADVIPSEPIAWQSWVIGGLKAAALVGVGVFLGIWFAGGISVGPDNKPEPTPVVPEPVKSFRVIFVKESGQTLSGEQVAIPGAKEIRDFLNAKTTAEGSQPGWREYDPQQVTDNEQPTMKALWNAVKPQLLPAPCLVVEVNGKATVMPFPATVAEAVETLKKHGGA